MAEPGWYPLPSDPSKVMYYDGAAWVGAPVPAPTPVARVEATAATGSNPLGELWDRAKDVAKDEEHQGTAMAIAGGAAIADGVVGIGKRPGLGGSIVTILFGIAFIVISNLMLNIFANSAAASGGPGISDGEVSLTVPVTSMGYDANGYCTPVVIVEGTEVPVHMTVRSIPCPLTVGQDITVFHVPDHPATARLAPDASSTTKNSLNDFIGVFRFVFIASGALVIAGGVLGLLKKLGVIAGGGVLMWLGLKRRKNARAEKLASDTD